MICRSMWAIMHRRRSLKDTLALLALAEVTCLVPTYRRKTYARHVRAWRESDVPMFPGYVFISSASLDAFWRIIDRPGKLLMSKETVVLLEDDVMRRYSYSGVLEAFKPGMAVVFNRGEYLLSEGLVVDVEGGVITVELRSGARVLTTVDTISPVGA